MPHVYIVRCANGELYVGMTDNVDERMRAHNDGRACLFTAKRRPITLVWSELAIDIPSAIARERQIKRWTRAKKEALISGELDWLRRLSQRRRW